MRGYSILEWVFCTKKLPLDLLRMPAGPRLDADVTFILEVGV